MPAAMQTKQLALCATLLVAILLVAGCTSTNNNTNNQNNTNGGNQTNSLTQLLNKANQITSMAYTINVTVANLPTGLIIHVWQKKPTFMKTEMNTTIPNLNMTITMITIQRPNGTFTYNSMSNKWIKSNETIAQTPPSTSELLNYNLTEAGTETVNGKLCTIVEYTTVTNNQTVHVRMWIWNEHGIPIKMRSTFEGQQSTTIMTMTDFNFAEIPDSTFDLRV
jgi:outer membrane lipoprotein-sorting protein